MGDDFFQMLFVFAIFVLHCSCWILHYSNPIIFALGFSLSFCNNSNLNVITVLTSHLPKEIKIWSMRWMTRPKKAKVCPVCGLWASLLLCHVVSILRFIGGFQLDYSLFGHCVCVDEGVVQLRVGPVSPILCVCPLAQGGGFVLGHCGAESVCCGPQQWERGAAAGRVCSGHRGHEDEGETPLPLPWRHCVRQTQVRNVEKNMSK